jgi:Flp pilus assembly protein TadD
MRMLCVFTGRVVAMDSSPEVISKEEGLRLLKAGQLDDAIRVLEKVRDKTDDPQVCSYLGAAYSQKDDKMNAIHAFEEALRLQETPKAYFNLAVMYESVGRIDEAVREYRMAAELDPSYDRAQEALTRLHDQFAASQPQPQV